MSAWIPANSSALPSEPGWYPTLSDWRTATLHAGAAMWLGSKWACSRERMVGFSLERFDCPHKATSRAFDLDVSGNDFANTNAAPVRVSMAAAAG